MSTQVNGTTTVRELVGQYPQTRKVFEDFGIDYCCGGGKCLVDAAQASRMELSALLTAVEKALAAPTAASGLAEKDWYTTPLHELDVDIHKLLQALNKQRTKQPTSTREQAAACGNNVVFKGHDSSASRPPRRDVP